MARKAKPQADPASGEAGRKRRTREHVIADLSINHVERLVSKCGDTTQRSGTDIKGHMRSHPDLLAASGYSKRRALCIGK